MPDILTQSQIDALLNNINDEPSAAKKDESKDKWRKYDFSSPKKFTKDKLRLLSSVYDNYARLLSLRLNGILRTVAEVEISLVEEQRYFEFNNMLDENDVMTTVNVKTAQDTKFVPMLVHVDTGLMVNMIDRMLGGLDDTTLAINSSYQYTEIELAIYEKVIETFISTTTAAWENYIDLNLTDTRVEENPMLFNGISLDEPVIIVSMNIKTAGANGAAMICIPGTLLTSVFTSLDEKKDENDILSEDYITAREAILTALNRSTMEISAVLEGTTLNIEDVYGLQVGDVIDLSRPKDSQVTLYIENQPWFEGRIGVYKRNTAIQIQNRLSSELIENEQI